MQHTRSYYGRDPTGMGFFWPESKQKRQEALTTRRNAPAQFEAVYQCNPGARSGVVFVRSDFVYYPQPHDWASFVSRGDYVIQAWDTAGSSNSTSDYSVCITALLVPCHSYHCGEDAALLGECEAHYDVYVMDVYRERKDFGDLVSVARELAQRWTPTAVLVEQKSTGDPLIGTLFQAGLPVEGVKPGILSKRARAVTSVGAGSVQGWMRMHRVYMPEKQPHCPELPWVEPLERELLNFTGDDGSVDDQVDSLVYLVSYAISQGVGGARLPTGVDNYVMQAAQALHQEQVGALKGPDALAALLGAQGFDPFQQVCDKCVSFDRGKQFCSFNKRKTIALDSCVSFADRI